MYKCNDCYSVFEEPKVLVERHGFSCGGYEKIKLCPFCNGEEIDYTDFDNDDWKESEYDDDD